LIEERIPLLKGEGAAKRRVRGEKKNLCTPHPVLRTTLSLQERELSRNIFRFGTLPTYLLSIICLVPEDFIGVFPSSSP